MYNLGFSELETYVYARRLNDLSLDWRSLADEFIKFEYDAAAAPFKAYWRENEELRKTTPMSMVWNPGLSAYRHLAPERMARWSRDFDKMGKKGSELALTLTFRTRLILYLECLAHRLKFSVSEFSEYAIRLVRSIP